ncbi:MULTISPECIES: SMP-30/gluconolactonase/LRE family protein [Nocardioides]|uniref:SMP-30/gluconolactonase/LRE family protein n=1 Tax=Nocardioides TaxID=1839 RepID=UPI000330DFEA|nr:MULTISPECIES: SMP-30/gluconolactonase/LRE family protein [Nocardioides]EON23664.1 strictosidine synthase [Nocardioides sp. CF8]
MTFTVHQVPGHGAEDVVVAPEGSVYTGTEDGLIWRLSADGRRIDKVAHTGGRPLGLELFADGDLLVCDADAGLLVVHVADGSIETLLSDIDGKRMRFCNNAAIAADGTIWFSDSSLHYGIHEWKDDFVQHTRTGRLCRRDLDGTVTVLIDDLAFANGVALSRDEQFVAVAETGARTVVRWWIAGPRAGERDFLVRDLPGYPDNIARGSDGLIWVTIASPKDPLVERLQTAPMALRKLVTRIPEKLQPKPKRTIRVQAFDDAGTLVHDIDLSDQGFHMVTGVREHAGRVWMGSLHEPAVAVLDLP